MARSISMRRVREARVPARTAAIVLASVLSLVGACKTASHAEPEFADVERAISARSTSPEELERAFELAELTPLSLPLPPKELRSAPEQDGFWHASVLAWNQAVHETRHAFQMARAMERSAGAPEPIEVGADAVTDGDEREFEVTASLDVLGLFGLGASKAARELAGEETRLAFAEYERTVWNAWIDVDRARVELESRRDLIAALDALADEQAPLQRRREILAARGFVASDTLATAQMPETMLAAERAALRGEIAEAREALALAAGLPSDAQALESEPPEPGGLDARLAALAPLASPTADVLWDARPEVRAMRVRCALAEARLRSVLAERFPELRLGLKTIFQPDTVLAGPLLDAAIAYPGARDGRIEAARLECEQMREAVQAELLAAIARARAAAEVWSTTHGSFERNAPALDEASRSAWSAARARALNDTEALVDAAAMLNERMKALKTANELERKAALAALEFRRAAGAPRMEVQP
jgi:outer membrane protein TolC